MHILSALGSLFFNGTLVAGSSEVSSFLSVAFPPLLASLPSPLDASQAMGNDIGSHSAYHFGINLVLLAFEVGWAGGSVEFTFMENSAFLSFCF